MLKEVRSSLELNVIIKLSLRKFMYNLKNQAKIRRQGTQIKLILFLQLLGLLTIISCNYNVGSLTSESCMYDNFEGKYLFYSVTDTSSEKIEITSLNGNKFQTHGIGGYGFWFPSASLSGEINDCQIKIDTYKDIKREGLSSPGGFERYYYESMSGTGEYFANNDSIKLFITYERTGDFTEFFNGEIFLIKCE